MTDQGRSNWWCERQRYGVVVVAAAAADAIRGWRTQTESTHRRVTMSCWPHRRGKSCSGEDRHRNQEKCQGALLTVVGGRGKRTVHSSASERTPSAWRGARGFAPTLLHCDARVVTARAPTHPLAPFDSRSSSAHSDNSTLKAPPLLSQLGSPSDLAASTWVETGRLCYTGLCYLTQAEKVSPYPAPEGSSSLQGHVYVYMVSRTS